MNIETHSVALDDMTTEQLVQVSQALGHQIEQLREQRQHLRKKIDARLDADWRAGMNAKIAELQGQLSATAPGKIMTAQAKR